jgi:SAM-dependent methyltransferase
MLRRMPDNDITAFWDRASARYDDEPDHGLRDPAIRDAWAGRLREWLPATPADVLDLGCGTGSLSLLALDAGHRVTAVDLSPEMVDRARAKTAGRATVLVGDAAHPPVQPGTVDVVLARHLAWTLPDPPAALARWVSLLRPGGRLVLVEGRWGEARGSYVDAAMAWPGGVGSRDLLAATAPLVRTARVEVLTDPALWGREIDDERYVLLAEL